MSFQPLPPASSKKVLEVTIEEELVPYFELLYNLKKKDGESENDFISRAAKDYGFMVFQQEQINAIQAEKMQEIHNEQKAIIDVIEQLKKW